MLENIFVYKKEKDDVRNFNKDKQKVEQKINKENDHPIHSDILRMSNFFISSLLNG